MKTYTHPQETWDEKECAKRARNAPEDHWGNRPPKGLISNIGSPHPQYGQTRRYNGGKIIDGDWYEAESLPLPSIPESYEIVSLLSWGKIIRKKQLTN